MGDCSRSFPKRHKSSRKQLNPKCFNGGCLNSDKAKRAGTSSNGNEQLCSSDDFRREKSENAAASSGDNSLHEKTANNNNNSSNNSKCDDDDEVVVHVVDEGEDEDMKAYTKNEVTVIDTSSKEWKSDKWVFRKKDSDEWKIKDKKSCFRGGRKRKFDDDNNNHEMMKKNKGDDKHGKEKKIMLLNFVQPQNEPSNFVIGKVSHSRFPCPKPPKKLRSEGSPVILLKSIPPSSNTNVVSKLGKSIHKKRPKKMKII